MTNNEKLEAIKDFLRENKIRFALHHSDKRRKIKGDAYVPKYDIIVKLSEGKEKDDAFFKKVRFRYHPLFIRNEETKEFVLEKMQNLIISILKVKHQDHQKRQRI